MSIKTKILVANVGSTSFKFVVFNMNGEEVLAKGGMEKIGAASGLWNYQPTGGAKQSGERAFKNHGEAIKCALELLMNGVESVVKTADEIAAVGFKPVMAKGISGTCELTEQVLKAMEEYYTLLPVHNPAYVDAVRQARLEFPGIPMIGTFETAFYDDVPEVNRRFAVPKEWYEKHHIRRNGFHGASHRFVTERAAQLLGRKDLRMISCHLGGSSSIAAVRNGVAVDSSWGMTPQSGLPQNNRIGDFDAFALIYLIRDLGLGVEKVEQMLMQESGLKGVAGTPTGDLRDIMEASEKGNVDAKLALDLLIKNIRNFVGQFLVELNGADVLIFTAGIAENNPFIRAGVCAHLENLGIELDQDANEKLLRAEGIISKPGSKIKVMLIPTSEETIIARNAWNLLKDQGKVSVT
ncbi:MAG: acetate/propionate family kinase [Verrucomicrobiota bacterium]|nr:acetate/propionate family kinase [Verrucomicrobiota bacterium]